VILGERFYASWRPNLTLFDRAPGAPPSPKLGTAAIYSHSGSHVAANHSNTVSRKESNRTALGRRSPLPVALTSRQIECCRRRVWLATCGRMLNSSHTLRSAYLLDALYAMLQNSTKGSSPRRAMMKFRGYACIRSSTACSSRV
jgi:hypothetical protein